MQWSVLLATMFCCLFFYTGRQMPEGYFVRPTVLRDVGCDSEIATEEIFGPVLSVIDCDGFDDAVRIANSVRYGMSGTVFTRDPVRIFEALERLTQLPPSVDLPAGG
ncbi:MAG: aldehyde dehydrogenase family protein [Pseudonocardia sp.]|nr:aldehyde dehydrogenase family protein [Pseudonocardia sp.]